MRFNITFTITGPTGKVVEAPNTTNPVEAEDIQTVLRVLADTPLPTMGGLLTILAVKIEQEL